MKVFFLFVFALLSVISPSGAQMVIQGGNNVFTNGRCVYTDGVIYENGQRRDATPSEIAQVNQWQAGMAQWGRDFSRYMNDKMSHLFDSNYNAGPQPQTPPAPCLCNPQYCDTRNGNNNQLNQQ